MPEAFHARFDVVDFFSFGFFFFSFFFLLVWFVLISLLVQYFSKVPLYTCNFVLYISPRLYKHSLQCVKFSVISSFYLIVGGGQVESFCFFDHHTYLITRTLVILFCNHLL